MLRFVLDDDVPPIISGCPSNIEIKVADHQVYEAVFWPKEPKAEDESGSTTLVRQSHLSGSKFPAGITSVLYVFADESQNIAKCTFQVYLGESYNISISVYAVKFSFSNVCAYCVIVDCKYEGYRLHMTQFWLCSCVCNVNFCGIQILT